jgi:hypothetical protein
LAAAGSLAPRDPLSDGSRADAISASGGPCGGSSWSASRASIRLLIAPIECPGIGIALPAFAPLSTALRGTASACHHVQARALPERPSRSQTALPRATLLESSPPHALLHELQTPLPQKPMAGCNHGRQGLARLAAVASRVRAGMHHILAHRPWLNAGAWGGTRRPKAGPLPASPTAGGTTSRCW